MSDVYSGYSKAVRLVNEQRAELAKKTGGVFKALVSSYCNAHARRKFVESERNFPDKARFYLDSYKEIRAQAADPCDMFD